MVKICEFENCRERARYGFDNETYCRAHRLEGMTSYAKRSLLCKHEGCNTRACYNIEGLKKGEWCNQHRTPVMINVVDKRCEHQGCSKAPTYDYEGAKKTGRFCEEHSLVGMVNVKIKHCEHEGCKSRPNFNYPNENVGKFCAKHRLENMIDLTHPTCEHEGCRTQPGYNYKGEAKGRFCKKHKLENMVDIKNQMSNCCIHENCIKQPSFNYKGEEKSLYCSEHRLEGMERVRDIKNQCPNCIDWIDNQRGNKKYKNYCARCFEQLFPLDPLTFQIRSKTKEIATRDFINATFQGFQHDEPLWLNGCDCSHKRRIDHRKLIGNTLLCIETDENQHKYYNKQDEIARYHDCFMALGCKFIFIRFNPDKYKDKDGKSKNPVISTRLFKLKEEIDKQIKRIEEDDNEELLEVEYLFYDES